MIPTDEIRTELTFYRSLRKRLSSKLRGLPSGSIYYKKMRGFYRPHTRIEGKETYLNASQARLIQDLTQRKELERSLKAIDVNLESLQLLQDQFTDLSALMPSWLHIVPPGQGPFYRQISKLSRNEITHIINQWTSDHYGRAEFLEEHKIHRTSDGTYVRSKSEVILYEHYTNHGLAFENESPLELGNRIRHPDFKLLRKRDGKLFIHEHFGMLSDPDYYARSVNTICLYLEHGFFPYYNFICTFDYEDGSIDLTVVDSILRSLGFID